MYIKAVENISPQNTFNFTSNIDAVSYSGNKLNCIEPDYKNLIDAKLIRRMSRIIKMGVAAGTTCLQNAGIAIPDAIVTGTAYGCLEDTGNFLTKLVEFNEELLTPTSFIQSTHNTIGAQIALQLQCNNYNNAFVHKGFSFESALQDGIMLLQENEANNVLVGAIDEITNISHHILNRLGLYKTNVEDSLQLFSINNQRTIAGEGAAFFVLSQQASSTDLAKLIALKTFYKPNTSAAVEQTIELFLKNNNVDIKDIDIVFVGKNGGIKNDLIYNYLAETIFINKETIPFKHLCGEYPTASAFGLWMSAQSIKNQSIPFQKINRKINLVLIYTNYLGIYHSLILVGK